MLSLQRTLPEHLENVHKPSRHDSRLKRIPRRSRSYTPKLQKSQVQLSRNDVRTISYQEPTSTSPTWFDVFIFSCPHNQRSYPLPTTSTRRDLSSAVYRLPSYETFEVFCIYNQVRHRAHLHGFRTELSLLIVPRLWKSKTLPPGTVGMLDHLFFSGVTEFKRHRTGFYCCD